MSILDHVPVHMNREFVELMNKLEPSRVVPLEVVGACPKCSCPIYGQKSWAPSEQPVAKHSCECFTRKPFEDTVEVK